MPTNTNFILKVGKGTKKGIWVTNPHQKGQNRKHIPLSQINCYELLNPRREKQDPWKRNIQHSFTKCTGMQMKPSKHLCASTSTLKGSFRERSSKMEWTPRNRQSQNIGVLWEIPNPSQMETQPWGKGVGHQPVLTAAVSENINPFSQPWTQTGAACPEESIKVTPLRWSSARKQNLFRNTGHRFAWRLEHYPYLLIRLMAHCYNRFQPCVW